MVLPAIASVCDVVLKLSPDKNCTSKASSASKEVKIYIDRIYHTHFPPYTVLLE